MESNLFQAIRLKDDTQYSKLIETVNINVVDDDGQSLLHEAIAHYNNGAAIDLINRGINVNIADNNGQVPLHFCALHKNPIVAAALLRNGADVNVKDIHLNNPLWTAVFNARGQYELVKLLLENGADPASKNRAGRSPLDFASQIDDKFLVSLLLPS
jgi:ankyrin repeat protein